MVGIGRDIKTGKRAFIPKKTRSTHMHVIGSTGTGKSKFLEWMIRKDIINENGLCLIDPHGYLYKDLVTWLTEKEEYLGDRQIILFDPSDEKMTFGFNPLRQGTASLSYLVDGMVEACAKVWGGEDMDKTPLLRRCLTIIFHALAENNLSLLEAQYLADFNEYEVRSYLAGRINDPVIRREWRKFNRLDRKTFIEYIFSTENRLLEFLKSPLIRYTIGQVDNTLNFRKAMDEGHIVLINLASRDIVSDANAQLLGSLIVNDLFMNARARPEGSRPFYCYIDECGLFVNNDVGRILDEGRKFGLHLILAHQHLAQLKKAGEHIYHSVMTNAKTKVIFGGLNFEDAEVMVKNVFLGELDLEEWKQGLTRPTIVGMTRTWFENYSKSRGSAAGSGHATGMSSSNATGEGAAASENNSASMVYSCDDQMFMIPNTVVESMGTAASQVQTKSASESTSESWNDFIIESESEGEGRSEGLEPIFEDLAVSAHTLEEQIWRTMAVMVNQPTQHAIIKMPGMSPQFVKVPNIESAYARDPHIKQFREATYKKIYFARPVEETRKAIELRANLLESEALKFVAKAEAAKEKGKIIDVEPEKAADFKEEYE